MVDRDGNIASLIQSLYLSLRIRRGGGRLRVPPCRIAARCLTWTPQHPNALAPRKRPLHTIIPAFMENDDLHIGFGIMGGYNQAQAHAQFVSDLVDHGMNIQAALEAPRFTKLTFDGCDLMIENRVPAGVREELAVRGHHLDVLGEFLRRMGGGQAVLHDSDPG